MKMTERDLENLNALPVPPPSARAKRAAMDAALAAFDATQTNSARAADAPVGVSDVSAQDSTQGNVVPLRQTETSPKKRSFLMRLTSRPNMAIAASLIALVIAAPIAFKQHDAVLTREQPVDLPAAPPAQTETALNAPPKNEQKLAEARQDNSASEQGAKLPTSEKQKEQALKEAIGKSAPVDSASPLIATQAPTSSDGKVNSGKVRFNGTEPGKDNKGLMTSYSDNTRILVDGAQPNILPMPSREPSTSAASAPADGKVVGGLSVGLQSQASDNTAVLVDRSQLNAPTAAAPAAPVAAGLGGADGKVAAAAPSSDTNAYVHDLGSTLGNHARFTGQSGPAQSGDLDTATGKRMLEHDPRVATFANPEKANPYAWMGHADEQRAIIEQENRDTFDTKEVNPVKQVATEPVSTFSTDVDTASYAFVRRALNSGRLPPKDAVRVEEMINYFPYAYPGPDSIDVPFKPTVTVTPSPWNPSNQLVHVAIKGYDLKSTERPRANLVFLMDVSGSMGPDDRLPMLKNAFRMLVDQLRPNDTVGIVTYASGSGVALEPTRVADKSTILRAIEQLGAGGSTAGAAGISDAYRLAEQGFEKNAVNRIILATDGDFNVGITDQNELKSFIERKRQSGIFLSILGVGQGNHNDALMQTLAQNGNGTAAYVDTLSEARKVLVDESSSTLFTIAKDVKVQIEWNPARVAEYRLIGYETRALKREDFNNDRIDAGDIGSGHTVTAIYEVTPVGAPVMSEELRYGKKTAATQPILRESDGAVQASGELGFLKLRYKRPNEDVSKLIELPIVMERADQRIDAASTEARFSIAVAAFGQLVRGSPYLQGYTYDDVLALAQSARGEDPFGYRAEFLNLVRLAKSARE
jgi:Ca-activated chloride channel homolog